VNGTRGLVIATAAAFVVGCSVGLMGGMLFMHLMRPGPFGPRFGHARWGPGPPFEDHRGGPRGERREGGLLPVLERELDLTPAQRVRIVAQLDRARHQQAAVRESMQVGIERELTPEQLKRWREMEERFERWRRERWPHPPGGIDRP